MSSKSAAAAPCDTPNTPAVMAPAAMRRAIDWGAEKQIPPWKVAGACQLQGITPATPVTEAAFDAAIEAVDGHSAGQPPVAGSSAKGSASE